MSQNDAAKKGFKTFILTLSISLIVFSVIYYFFTSSDSGDTTGILSEESTLGEPVSDLSVNTDSTNNNEATITETQQVDASSSFADLVKSRSAGEPRDVLAGSTTATTPTTATGTGTGTGTTPTTSTTGTAGGVIGTKPTTQTSAAVPASGTLEMTIALIFSVLVFAAAFAWQYMNPRRVALHNFERSILDDLDRF